MRNKRDLIDLYLQHKRNGNFIRAGQIKAELKSKHGITDKELDGAEHFGMSGLDMFAEIFGGGK